MQFAIDVFLKSPRSQTCPKLEENLLANKPEFAPINTGALVLANGRIFQGIGFGAIGEKTGEVCFNTAITGYQEILTDPSYCQQIIVFTTPHIGNVGTNLEDEEAATLNAAKAALGLIVKGEITSPSNWRSGKNLNEFLKGRDIIGLSGIDTRALTHLIREEGMQHGCLAYNEDGKFDFAAMQEKAKNWAGLEGLDLAKDVTTENGFGFDKKPWNWPQGFEQNNSNAKHVVVMDFGVKANILRDLNQIGAKVSVVDAKTSFEEIIALKPDGVVLSNGPGDPAATAIYAAPVIKALIEANIPIFGICLGHQMLGIALGAKTLKMKQGHHGANHPVKDLRTGKVEIVSMNHGFAIDAQTLPKNVTQTHISLFDGSNCGIALQNKKVFSVQYHPEANPGPKDSFYLFEEFANSL